MEEGDVRNETAFVTEMNWHFAEVGENTLCQFRGGDEHMESNQRYGSCGVGYEMPCSIARC